MDQPRGKIAGDIKSPSWTVIIQLHGRKLGVSKEKVFDFSFRALIYWKSVGQSFSLDKDQTNEMVVQQRNLLIFAINIRFFSVVFRGCMEKCSVEYSGGVDTY